MAKVVRIRFAELDKANTRNFHSRKNQKLNVEIMVNMISGIE